jgi:hypothetical protein
MLSEGFYDGEIKRAVAAKYNLSPRTVERYLRRARDQIIAESGRPLVEHQTKSLAFYCAVRRGTMTVQGPTGPIMQIATISERLRAQERIDQLMGLEAPTQIHHAGAVGGPILVKAMSDEDLDKDIAERQRKIAALTDLLRERPDGSSAAEDGGGGAAAVPDDAGAGPES